MTTRDLETRPPDSRRQSLLIVGGVTALAFALRLVHLLEARSVVFFRLLVSDGEAYWAWADRIAGGDWLGDSVFYQAPLYPYFLAILKLVVGDDLFWIRLVQIVVGSLSCAMLSSAGIRFFGRRAGAIAGVLLAIYPTAIFFDVIIQKTVLATFWVTILLWAIARAPQRPTALGWSLLGAVLGLLVLTRENALLFGPVIALWVLIGDRMVGLRRRAGRLALVGVGAAVVLLPVGMRNLFVGGEFALTTSQAGPNFYIGNNPHSDGSYSPLRPGRSDTPLERVDARELAEEALGRSLSPNEVSDYWFDRAWDFIRDDPAAWGALLIRKLRMVLNTYEVPDAEDILYYAERCALIRWLSVVYPFGVLCPLGVAGVVLTASTWRRTWILHALLVTVVAGVVAFFVFSRYRFPMVPILVLFAAGGIASIPTLVRNRSWPTVSAGAVALIATAMLANWKMFDAQNHLAITYSNAGVALMDAGRLDEAIEQNRIAVRLSPGTAESHFNLGEALQRSGDPLGAATAFRNAATIEPNDPEIPAELGNSLAALGQFEAAAEQFRRSLALRPNDVGVINNLGACMVQLGRTREAIAAFRRALSIAPDQVGTSGNLAWILATCEDHSLRDPAEAVKLAERACELTAYQDANLMDTLATAYAEAGRFDDAARTARAALERARVTNRPDLMEALQRKIVAYDARR